MIQDIFPSKLNNHYTDCQPSGNDSMVIFSDDSRLLARAEAGVVCFPKREEVSAGDTVFLFSLDDRRYFLPVGSCCCSEENYGRYTIRELRDLCGGKELYAAFTAYHLWKWYHDNRYCGKCGDTLLLHNPERALKCPGCGNMIYPRINPAVIVGVIRGESLLITRYRKGYAHNALVAGFTEIGETLEQTVEREVMEETGVAVENIRYYKSQPWGMAQDILVGFFCNAVGSGEIHMDENELKYAEWVSRDEIVLQPNNLSLTNEMMRVFKEGIIR